MAGEVFTVMPDISLPHSIQPHIIVPPPSPPPSFASRIDAWLDTTRTPEPFRRRSKRSRSDQDSPALGRIRVIQEVWEPENKRAKLQACQLDGESEEAVDTMQRGQPPTPNLTTPTKSISHSSSGLLSPSATTEASQSTCDVSEISTRLDRHGLIYAKGRLKSNHTEFYDELQERIGRPLSVEMTAESVKRIDRIVKKYGAFNEDTFLNECLPLIVKKEYKVADPTSLKRKLLDESGEETQYTEVPAQYVESGKQYKSRYWEDEGITTFTNKAFKSGFLPSRFEPQVLNALKKHDAMTDPKPDRTYVLDAAGFPLPDDLPEEVYTVWPEVEGKLTLLPNSYHPFFLDEGKSNNGNAGIARLQLRRGGAAIVNALRLFLTHIGIPDIVGLDRRTYCFSMAIDPTHIALFVHWAEVDPSSHKVKFYMDFYDGTLFEQSENIPRIHRNIENILSWGCTERKLELQEYHRHMHQWLIDEAAARKAKKAQEDEEKRRAVAEATNAKKEARRLRGSRSGSKAGSFAGSNDGG